MRPTEAMDMADRLTFAEAPSPPGRNFTDRLRRPVCRCGSEQIVATINRRVLVGRRGRQHIFDVVPRHFCRGCSVAALTGYLNLTGQ